VRPPLERSTTWAGLQAGDPVEVEGTRLRAAHWTFLAHVRNGDTGEEWVEVVGGRQGDRKLRSFRPEQVYAPRGRRAGARRAASLAEAPQLPFG
jgi:hypothetical protein